MTKTEMFCDRCNKSLYHAGLVGVISMGAKRGFYDNSHKRETFDLCYKCMKSFENWLKNEVTP